MEENPRTGRLHIGHYHTLSPTRSLVHSRTLDDVVMSWSLFNRQLEAMHGMV
jgi:hypothetical protein